jgi:hypothetical protein
MPKPIREPWEQRVWLQCRIRALKIARGEPPRPRAPLSRRAECPVTYRGPRVEE